MSAYSGNNEVSPGQTLLLHINIAQAAALLLQGDFRVPVPQAYGRKLIKMSKSDKIAVKNI